MAEVGTKRQRAEETTNLTPSERTEGLARRPSSGMGRSSPGYSPSMSGEGVASLLDMRTLLCYAFLLLAVTGCSDVRYAVREREPRWQPSIICTPPIQAALGKIPGSRDYLKDDEVNVYGYEQGNLMIRKMAEILQDVEPYVIFKKAHVRRALELLPLLRGVKDPEVLLHLAHQVDAFATLNYSKTKRISAADVEQHLRSMGVLCPCNDFLASNSEGMA